MGWSEESEETLESGVSQNVREDSMWRSRGPSAVAKETEDRKVTSRFGTMEVIDDLDKSRFMRIEARFRVG